ncbi:MAG: hypothetical protein HY547_04545 [Elusimicrobia bacterium]|nr:hypothetical protein [Elusimicrobiota bacterium]
MNSIEAPETLLWRESRIKIPYAWAAGETASRFFIEIRDRKKIFGTKCPSCDKVYCPPKKTCGDCFSNCGEWLEVGPDGEITGFTQALYEGGAHPVKNPVGGLILLRGASTAMLHLIGQCPLEELKIGMKVTPVFKENRQGNILDILHFIPAKQNHG